MHIRSYGSKGSEVILIHGGPGAMGDLRSLAKGLEHSCRVYEPWQRRSGDLALTVAQHIEDLHAMIEHKCQGKRPFLIGHSWGAMLALAYASSFPDHAGPIVLLGCGTFDEDARACFKKRLAERFTPESQKKFDQLDRTEMQPDERLRALASILLPLFSYDQIEFFEPEECDAKGHEETWRDMMRLQEENIYPEAFRSIKSPVLMLHGQDDPHPGTMTRDTLKQHLPQLEYHEWAKCGHSPWLERAVHVDVLTMLREWIGRSSQAEALEAKRPDGINKTPEFD